MRGASLSWSTSEPLGRVRPARRRPKGRPAWESSSSDDGNRLFEHFWGSSESSDESIDLQHVRRLRKQRLKRSCAAYPYGGDLLARIENKHEDESKNWAALPQHEVERRWLAEFRMPEDVFEELLALVQPHMQDSVPQNTKQRTYTVKEKLLVTLNFLAHCPTLRQMADKWGMPHCSISQLCIQGLHTRSTKASSWSGCQRVLGPPALGGMSRARTGSR